MLRIDKKEKEKIKRMYKDNPLIQYIAETIFEDELKKYQEKLKQKEREAKQKEEELKQKEREKEREIIEILLRIKIRENIDHIIIKLQKIEDISTLNKIRKILELELPKEEYLNQINQFI